MEEMTRKQLIRSQSPADFKMERNTSFCSLSRFASLLFQLSVYTTTRSNIGTESNIDLVLNVENFDVESKFERYYGFIYTISVKGFPL